jgi:hypothetical protein
MGLCGSSRVKANKIPRAMSNINLIIEERFIDWNFVASDKALIAAAKQKWIAQQFEKIKGEETEFVPYPTFPKK